MTANASKQLARGAPVGHTALIIMDMISCWDFPDADKLQRFARRITHCIARLAGRCRRSDVPVIYANDNRGRWRSDFPKLVDLSLQCGGAAAEITRTLAPADDDYFVLKPMHSAFYGTPLHLLLTHLNVQRLIITGVSSDQCVMTTVAEARMRTLDVVVPRDCVASQSTRCNEVALRQFADVHRIATTPSARLRLLHRPAND
ncbi:isochorismatase family cysteine hydrolase [Variovorax rhizosphaerae]|uniref:Isochorismatase family cysteine hydrolase n=1 Tax=Variovorax rhizosphaerae TaxID=1836200 RepID=A0ABU8X169_9BURK